MKSLNITFRVIIVTSLKHLGLWRRKLSNKLLEHYRLFLACCSMIVGQISELLSLVSIEATFTHDYVLLLLSSRLTGTLSNLSLY